MFKKVLTEAFNWNLKWYLGSFSSSVMTFFFFEKYIEFERIRSFRYGVFIFLATFILRALIQYINKIDELEKIISQRDDQLDILNSKKRKKKNTYFKQFLWRGNSYIKRHFC